MNALIQFSRDLRLLGVLALGAVLGGAAACASRGVALHVDDETRSTEIVNEGTEMLIPQRITLLGVIVAIFRPVEFDTYRRVAAGPGMSYAKGIR